MPQTYIYKKILQAEAFNNGGFLLVIDFSL